MPETKRRERVCQRFAKSQNPWAERGGRGSSRDFVYGTRRFGRPGGEPPLTGTCLRVSSARGQGRHRPACAGRSGLGPPSWPFGSGFRADGATGCQRSVRGMNDPGKTHPAGKARWVRTTGTARAVPVNTPDRFSPKLAGLTTRLPGPGQSSANCAAGPSGIHIETTMARMRRQPHLRGR